MNACDASHCEGSCNTLSTVQTIQPIVNWKGCGQKQEWPTLKYILSIVTRRNVARSIPNEVIGCFNLPNPSSRTMAVGSTQPLTEMSTRNLPAGKERPEREADNLTAICEPIL
jgi:hypothetical protein